MHLSRFRRVALGAGAALGVLALAPAAWAAAPIQPLLADQLAGAAADTTLAVAVHGTDIAAARDAVRAADLRHVEDWRRIGVAVAVGTPAQIRAAAEQPGVTYLEGDRRLQPLLATSHRATRGVEAAERWATGHGVALDGRGVSIAVIDSGIDAGHPMFRGPDGSSAVVRAMKYACGPFVFSGGSIGGEDFPPDHCFVPSPTEDSDITSLGGHGTHVASIAAGRRVTIDAGRRTIQGAAPGAKLVAMSGGAGLHLFGTTAALNWVLEHHEAPCGEGVSPVVCPPIKVTNNSYGYGPGEFDPNSANAKAQRALAADGVVTVWAAGNDGGDGSANRVNSPAMDPTPGVIAVAAYDDGGTGTRDGAVASFSSRGHATRPATWPDLSAPGARIEAACRAYLPVCSTGLKPVDNGDYNTISGTSMAAPHVAGIVAQLFQALPEATPAQIEDALVQTAYPFAAGAAYATDPARGGLSSFDKGHGLVDVVAAVDRLTGAAPLLALR